MSLIVLKFGGAAVATPEQFSKIADIIIDRRQLYDQVVIVVSAMGDTTDQLIELAKKVNPNPPQREYDMLVTVGERISISLLAMALAGKNQSALSLTGSQSGIITCARHTEARIVDVRPHRVKQALESGQICIVAGFQGVSEEKNEITTLGRGGSDTTAVALGVALKARKVEFFKDVEGIYDLDPKKYPEARLQQQLSYKEALHIASNGVLQNRCIELANRNNLLLHVLPFEGYRHSPGTIIYEEGRALSAAPRYER
jgi:aspartate kinase